MQLRGCSIFTFFSPLPAYQVLTYVISHEATRPCPVRLRLAAFSLTTPKQDVLKKYFSFFLSFLVMHQ